MSSEKVFARRKIFFMSEKDHSLVVIKNRFNVTGDQQHRSTSTERPRQDNTRGSQHQSFPNLDLRRPIADPHLSWPPELNSSYKKPLLSTPSPLKMPYTPVMIDLSEENRNRMPIQNTTDDLNRPKTGVTTPVSAKSRSELRYMDPETRPRPNIVVVNKSRSRSPSGDQREALEGDAIMTKAETIFRKIMGCISPEDPKVDQVANPNLKNIKVYCATKI